MDNVTILVFQLAVLIFSVMIHEISHGAVALSLGDQTAKRAGRLTFNPIKHIDPFGSIILPILLFLLSGGSMILGWAKPVPYNPFNLKNPKRGAGIIAAAGPASNLIIAAFFAVALRFMIPFAQVEGITTLAILVNFIILINILLAVFNLLPIPPLDGSGILFSLLPDRYQNIRRFLYRYGFFLLILFIFFGFQLILPLIYGIYGLLVGPFGF
jgi:Zn-dependent protease